MLENPCIELGQDRCRFYTEEQGGHCLIMQADQNYNRVRDRFGEKMTARQIEWFEHNCPVWPTGAKDIDDLCNRRYELPPSCGFELVES